MSDCWNPVQYEKFSIERTEPFYDLVQLITFKPDMNIVDLGCGTGALTARLHEIADAKKTLGIDISQSMLAESQEYKKPNLDFQLMNIEDFSPMEKYDLIFSNAALQWVPNQEKLIERFRNFLTNQGQIAIQVPANFDHPAHLLAKEIANELYATKFGKGRNSSVLSVEEYAHLFYRLGFTEQLVRLQVYAHVLESTESVVEWLKGSLFTYYQSKLTPQEFDRFLETYRERLIAHYGMIKPFFLGFKRILLWAEL